MTAIIDRAQQVLLAHLDQAVSAVTLGETLAANAVTLRQSDAVAVAVGVEADPARPAFGSDRIRYGIAEIEAVASTSAGVALVTPALVAMHGWAPSPDFPADGTSLPADFDAPANLRGTVAGLYLRRTTTDEDTETGAVIRTYRYQVIFGG